MKQYVVWIVTLILAIGAAVLLGCGKEEEQDIYVLWTDTEDLPVPSVTDKELRYLDMQYYQGEPVQFWGKIQEDGAGEKILQVFLYGPDDSSRLLFNAVPIKYYNNSYNWFLAQDGSCILLRGEEIVRLDPEGRELYSRSMQNSSQGICQLSDGSIFLLTLEFGTAAYHLEQLDPETGAVKNVDAVNLGNLNIQDGYLRISAGENGILLLDNKGFWEINASTGKKTRVLDFTETNYELSDNMSNPEDFRMTVENQAELLLRGSKVKLYLVNVSRERTIITVRLVNVSNWLQECTARFNKENEIYYVLLEQPDENMDWADRETRALVDMAGGKLDIVDGVILPDMVGSIENGGLADLAPLMEEAGIREEDYFPMAFDAWRDGQKIYGVTLDSFTENYWISEELLEDGTPDIETLVDNMLLYQGGKVMGWTWDERGILEFLLSGSENLWGMIDWEEGACDFKSGLFGKMLEAAKKLKYDSVKNSQDQDYLLAYKYVRFYGFFERPEMNTEGKVEAGWLFDDGFHPIAATMSTFAIPSTAPHKEGAWEFLCYLLGEEQQSEMWKMLYNDWQLPVNRKAFEAYAEREIEVGAIEPASESNPVIYKAGRDLNGLSKEEYRALYDLTPERVEKIREDLEKAKYAPYRTEHILDIIYEETAAYFAGDKSLEEVCDIIESRVGIYV